MLGIEKLNKSKGKGFVPGGKVPSKPGLGGVLGNTMYLLGWLLQGRGKSAWVG